MHLIEFKTRNHIEMIRLIYTLFFCLLITACNEVNKPVEPVVERLKNEVFADSSRNNRAFVSRLNSIDSLGYRQGTWITKNTDNEIKETHHYLNDTLNGYWYENHHGFTQRGYYENGLRQGFFWTIRTGDYDRLDVSLATNLLVYTVIFYQNDTAMWLMSPETDIGRLVPVRGPYSELDSVYTEAEYLNGTRWYEGSFSQGRRVGIHKIYFPNGKLFGTVNYETGIVMEYDSLGHFLGTDSLPNQYKNREP